MKHHFWVGITSGVAAMIVSFLFMFFDVKEYNPLSRMWELLNKFPDWVSSRLIEESNPSPTQLLTLIGVYFGLTLLQWFLIGFAISAAFNSGE